MGNLVRDMMSTDVAVIGRESDVHELEKLLLTRGVHGVPVVDDRGRIVGVVSQTDLLAWHFQSGIDGVPFYDRPDDVWIEGERPMVQVNDIRTARISEVMSPLIHCIRPERDIAEAAARMVRERIHRLVVVDPDYAVVGILSATDLLRAVPGVEQQLAVKA